MSWNRIYRPRTIAGLHSTTVREQFLQLLDSGKLPQVMLFTGPKGTGKTSTARIISAIANHPKNQPHLTALFSNAITPHKLESLLEPEENEITERIFTGTSFVVQELDAASHRGIDDVRALKERLSIPPPPENMTVVILDEAHMLTTDAFNALLKILEEPPNYAVFILATTEAHKIPATITSRCHVVEFQQANQTEITTVLEHILNTEGVTYQPEAVQYIAEYAQGSFRDAIKYAELSSTQGSLTIESVTQHLGPPVEHVIEQLLKAVIAKDPATVCKAFVQLRSTHVQPKYFMYKLLTTLHQSILVDLEVVPGNVFITKKVALYLLQQLQHIPAEHSSIPFLPLEIVLLEIIFKAQKQTKSAIKNTSVQPLRLTTPSVTTQVLESSSQFMPSSFDASPKSNSAQKVCLQWQEVVQKVRAYNISIGAILQSAIPKALNATTVEITVFYPFHKEQLLQSKFAAIIQEAIFNIAQLHVNLQYTVAPHLSQTPTLKPESHEALLETASKHLL